MNRRGPDPVSLVAGFAVIAVGVLLGLDQLDLASLSIGIVAAALCAAAGAILVASGLARDQGRDDG